MSQNRGGSREGAGRKAIYDEPTKVIRVPASRIIEIKNYLIKNKNKSIDEISSIHQIEARTHVQIPMAAEKVSAGFPSPAQDYAEKLLDMNEMLVHNKAATFMVKVASLSMRDAGIDIDDELLVDRSIQAKHKDIVIAYIDNEFTVKRLMIEDNQDHWLKAENPDFSDIHLKEGQEMHVWGVVTYVIKSFKKYK